MQNEAISRFAQFTGSHLGDAMTITLDGSVLLSASIEDEIPDGSAGIGANFILQQANAIVAALKSGVLPVELKKLS
jgi:preprotein translocase subunit SecD